MATGGRASHYRLSPRRPSLICYSLDWLHGPFTIKSLPLTHPAEARVWTYPSVTSPPRIQVSISKLQLAITGLNSILSIASSHPSKYPRGPESTVTMEGTDRHKNFSGGAASFPKRRQSRESHAANVAFPDVFHDSFASGEATRHGPDRSPRHPRKNTPRYLMAALLIAAPILIAVMLQFVGRCDRCIQSLANDPFGRVGRLTAASYFALAFSGLVAVGLSKLKDKMTRKPSREYLKDCNN